MNMVPRSVTRLLTCLVFLALLVPGARAQEKPGASGGTAPTSEVEGAEYVRAPVVLDGKILFRVRGVTAYPAEQRAQAIGERIEAIAADRSISVDALHLDEAEGHVNVVAGDRFVMRVYDADAEIEGVSRQLLAEAVRRKTAEAIVSYRHARSPQVLLTSSLYALGATLAALLLLLACRDVFRRLDAAAERRFKSRIKRLEIQSHRLIHARQLWTALRGVLRVLHTLAVLVTVYLYLHLVLGLYPWTRPVAQRLVSIVLEPLHSIGVAVLGTLPDLLFIGILALVTRYVLKLVRLYFAGIDQGTITLPGFFPEWAWPTYKIVRVLVIAFALVVAYPYIPGSESEAFKGISIFLGVIFSLGSSSVISNVIAGYTLTYRRAFKVGDRIQVNEFTGDVVETRLLVTHLRTVKNEEIVVPNSLILNSHVLNYSTLARSHGLILHATVGIGYETPWRQVEAMLLLAAVRTPGLLKEPPPFVLQKSLGDFAVTYEINAYCDNPQDMVPLHTGLQRNILDVFNEYGVQIMTPAYVADPHQPKMVPREQWYAAPATVPGAETAPGEQDKPRN